MSAFQTVALLGIRFFNGTPAEAVKYMLDHGGLLAAPSGTCFERFVEDGEYRQAIVTADLALADSGFMVVLAQYFLGARVHRISGLAYLQALLRNLQFDIRDTFWILPTESARERLVEWARVWSAELGAESGEQAANSGKRGAESRERRAESREQGAESREQGAESKEWGAGSRERGASSGERGAESTGVRVENTYVAPMYGWEVVDRDLLARLDQLRPRNIIIGVGAGPQEKLGYWLREHLSYRPAIHCIGGALGFVTGDQVAIPGWADRFYLGWLLRLLSQPRVFVPRLARGRVLPWLIWKYGHRLPPIRRARRAR